MKEKKKNAVVTINIGKRFTTLAKLTIPFMERYADKIGADFIVIDKIKKNHESQYSAYWAKFQLYDIFADYDRVLFLDLDTLVYPHCPDVFAVVPVDKFGVLLETDHSIDQTEEILEIQTRAGDINWRQDYFNVGVMVVSSVHREVFNLKHGNQGGGKYPEQTQINFNVQRFKIPIFRLDYRFNHTYFWGAPSDLRAQSYIVHYAAITHDLRVALIEEDIKRYYDARLPVQDVEIESFFESHFPGKNLKEFMKEYRLLKDSEI